MEIHEIYSLLLSSINLCRVEDKAIKTHKLLRLTIVEIE